MIKDKRRVINRGVTMHSLFDTLDNVQLTQTEFQYNEINIINNNKIHTSSHF